MIILWSSYDHLMIILWSSYNYLGFISLNQFTISLQTSHTILWLSHNYCNIILQFYDRLTIISWSSYNHLMIILQLPHNHLTIILRLSNYQFVIILQSILNFPITFQIKVKNTVLAHAAIWCQNLCLIYHYCLILSTLFLLQIKLMTCGGVSLFILVPLLIKRFFLHHYYGSRIS